MPAATPPTPLPAPAALMIDLDGTLVDTVGDFTVALNAMLAELGRQDVTREQVARLREQKAEIDTAISELTRTCDIVEGILKEKEAQPN